MRSDEPGPEIVVVIPADARLDRVLELASSILQQDRYLRAAIDHAVESHVVAAFERERCLGFLRFHIQVIGSDVGRPPVSYEGSPLREGYVDAFGVEPTARRRGIGNAMQTTAIDHCRRAGCHQMRSRSPVTSTENYALKIEAGYTLHPSSDNDSYYFSLAL